METIHQGLVSASNEQLKYFLIFITFISPNFLTGTISCIIMYSFSKERQHSIYLVTKIKGYVAKTRMARVAVCPFWKTPFLPQEKKYFFLFFKSLAPFTGLSESNGTRRYHQLLRSLVPPTFCKIKKIFVHTKQTCKIDEILTIVWQNDHQMKAHFHKIFWGGPPYPLSWSTMLHFIASLLIKVKNENGAPPTLI